MAKIVVRALVAGIFVSILNACVAGMTIFIVLSVLGLILQLRLDQFVLKFATHATAQLHSMKFFDHIFFEAERFVHRDNLCRGYVTEFTTYL